MSDSTDDHITHIKKFCSILDAANITHVFAEYDGSGDSGDMSVRFSRPRVIPAVGHLYGSGLQPGEMNPTVQTQELSEATVKSMLVTSDKPLTTLKAFDDFIGALWRVLPGGWEIDDGSYGDVNVDVATRQITVNHNERFTDVRSSEYAW